jgi:hypothetical protein
VYGWHIQNLDTTDNYVHFYDALTANVTVGTTTPVFTLWVPASSGLDVYVPVGPREQGIVDCVTGLVIAATTTIGGLTSNTNGCLVNLVYV